MKKFRIIISNGKCKAPSLIVFESKPNEAVKKAKTISGLARFDSWNFNAIEMKRFNAKSKRRQS